MTIPDILDILNIMDIILVEAMRRGSGESCLACPSMKRGEGLSVARRATASSQGMAGPLGVSTRCRTNKKARRILVTCNGPMLASFLLGAIRAEVAPVGAGALTVVRAVARP